MGPFDLVWHGPTPLRHDETAWPSIVALAVAEPSKRGKTYGNRSTSKYPSIRRRHLLHFRGHFPEHALLSTLAHPLAARWPELKKVSFSNAQAGSREISYSALAELASPGLSPSAVPAQAPSTAVNNFHRNLLSLFSPQWLHIRAKYQRLGCIRLTRANG